MSGEDKKTIRIVLTSDEYEILTLAAKFYLAELNEDRDAANLAAIYVRKSLERIKRAVVAG